ncbi:ArsR/SmtB family transcription factor [Streptomyces microflavus]|uniref:ArsR/SmtB family transcription factor n=1 Tax=Streptomyces microflavus TaxID=1919 RepID=UPI0033AF46AD
MGDSAPPWDALVGQVAEVSRRLSELEERVRSATPEPGAEDVSIAVLSSDWSETADTLGALGHPVRLRLIQALAGGRSAVAELVELEGLGTTGQIYHHLRQLVSAGWLETTGRGRYQIPPARLVPLLVVVTEARR